MARVLIDFDNVVLMKNPKALAYVKRRNEAFIGRFIKTTNPRVLPELHRYIKTACGHVALGMQRLGYEKATVESYNEFVFPKNFDYNAIWNDGAFCDKKDMENMLRIAHDNQLYVFSSTPLEWSYNFMRLANSGVADHVQYLTPKDPKPLKSAFDSVEAALGKEARVYYIDSDPQNIISAFGRPGWSVLGLADENWRFTSTPVVFVRDLRDAEAHIAYDRVCNAMYHMPPK